MFELLMTILLSYSLLMIVFKFTTKKKKNLLEII